MATAPTTPAPGPAVVNLPNGLTLARLLLAVVLFGCIAGAWWLPGMVVFALAALTDWLDGYLARKQGLTSAFGRNFEDAGKPRSQTISSLLTTTGQSFRWGCAM